MCVFAMYKHSNDKQNTDSLHCTHFKQATLCCLFKMLFQTCFGLYLGIRETIHTYRELLPALHVYHICVSYEAHKLMI